MTSLPQYLIPKPVVLRLSSSQSWKLVMGKKEEKIMPVTPIRHPQVYGSDGSTSPDARVMRELAKKMPHNFNHLPTVLVDS